LVPYLIVGCGTVQWGCDKLVTAGCPWNFRAILYWRRKYNSM